MSVSSGDIRQRLLAVWRYADAPQRLAHATLDNYVPGCAEQEAALRKCREYVKHGMKNISRGKGFLLKGPVGTGKSHLSVATVRALIEANPNKFGRPTSRTNLYGEPDYQGYRCSVIPVFDLLERLRESYSSRGRHTDYGELVRRCKVDDVIILDDIGAEKPTDWVEEQLYGLIDLRYRTQRSTFFTTNCSLTNLEVKIGARALSRILEMCECISVGGEDWRKTHRDQE